MSKKNDKRAIQKRHNIVKKQMMEQQRKRQDRKSVKELCRNLKSHLQNITLGLPKSNDVTPVVEEVDMADAKPIRRGNHFLRELGTGEKMTARRKKVLKDALKRRRKLGV